ncbi:Titin [Phytophthora nicotianae]|uniref:Titin n=1 Tax=Phytophthora nicotianae TaxID=4792 RepID=A0A0W8BWK8_PHYNI|nr:Titin [Phytophthora nicotianae]
MVPYVKGVYKLSVRLPAIDAVHAVITQTDSALGGSFYLSVGGKMTTALSYAALDTDVKTALEALSTVGVGNVATSLSCTNGDATKGCRWLVTFRHLTETVASSLGASYSGVLTGNNAVVVIRTLTQPRAAQMVNGFPKNVRVNPGVMNPTVSTAYGPGLYASTSGILASFFVQMKDTHGNNLESDTNYLQVQVFPAGSAYLSSQVADVSSVAYISEGLYKVSYTPVLSGRHTVVVTTQTSPEVHKVSSTFALPGTSRGGTFALRLFGQTTAPLVFEANATDVQQALLNLPVFAETMNATTAITVTRAINNQNGFDYLITYTRLPPDLELDVVQTVNNLYSGDGGSGAMLTSTLQTSQSREHVKTSATLGEPIMNEQQVVTVTSTAVLTGGSFQLQFGAHTTDLIVYNAAAATLENLLNQLPSIGTSGVSVSLTTSTATVRAWTVTFLAATAGTPQTAYWNSVLYTPNRIVRHARLVGDIPVLKPTPTHTLVAGATPDGTVAVTTPVTGVSPFTTIVAHGALVPTQCTAVDGSTPFKPGSVNAVGQNGLHSGRFHSRSSFIIEARDTNGNLLDGTGGGFSGAPVQELQIVETFSSAGLGNKLTGTFALVLDGQKTAALPANAGIQEVEAALEALDTLSGFVTVDTPDVQTLVTTGTVIATKTSNVLTTSASFLTVPDFVVGDWIRIGSLSGPVFSITAITATTITLSGIYQGVSDNAANVYKQSDPGAGFTYRVKFAAELGDLPALAVYTTKLGGGTGTGKATVTACDYLRTQQVHTTAASQISGDFSLSFRGNTTPMLPWNVDANTLSRALEALDGIHSATVATPVTGTNGGYTWLITLVSTEPQGDQDLELLYAEGYLLLGKQARIQVTPVCPSTKTRENVNVQSVSGSEGHSFVPVLRGASTVVADVSYLGGATYKAVYDTPREAAYSLDVRYVAPRGLMGSYFDNRWLYGTPTLERVDPLIDFMWKEERITPTSREHVSVRWQGYVKPSFSEDYTFYVLVNDGARLWIENQLVIDQYDFDVDASTAVEFQANASVALIKDRLTEITLEYRENSGVASVSLLWQSHTQPKRIVPSARLFHRSDAIMKSPFNVVTQGSKPSSPTNISLTISAADALLVHFNAPGDDGGAPMTGYQVEWWTYGAYGSREVQVVKIATGNTGGTFTLTLDNGQVTGPLSASALYSDVEIALEALDGAGDVTVTSVLSANSRDYTITFNSRVGTVPAIQVDTTQLVGSKAYIVCSKGATQALANGMQCTASESTTSTVQLLSSPATFTPPDVPKRGDPYAFLISGLTQPSASVEPNTPGEVGGTNGPGFSVRVLAKNSAGYGLPSATASLKPMALPAAPTNVELRLVAGSSTSLRLWWNAPTTNNGAIITYYVVEWRLDPPGRSNSEPFSSFRETPGFFLAAHPASLRFKYTVDNLVPGATYAVQVRAQNIMGVGPVGQPVPSFEVPRSKASPLLDGTGGGVALSVRPASSSVLTAASCTSLLLSWLPVTTADAHGAAVTSYVVDWYQPQSADTSPFEVQTLQIFGKDAADVVKGTFRVQYSGAYTEPLAIDVSEAELEDSLESLPALRSVEVERTAFPSRGGYQWAVTFLSEAPAVLGKVLSIDSTTLTATILTTDVGAQLAAPVGSSSITVAVVQGSNQVTSTDTAATGALVDMYVSISQGLWRVTAVSVATGTATLTLSGNFPGANGNYPALLGWTVPGVLPVDYHSKTIPATNATDTYSLVLDALPPGTPYSARVSACNSLGCNAPTMASPLTLAAPKQKPATPLDVALFADSGSTLRVRWRHPPSDGGNVITHYRVEWDPKPTFDSGVDSAGESSKGSSLGYERKAVVNPGVDCLLTPCEAVIGSLERGTPYYVRVYAYNSLGYSVEAGYPVVPGFGVPKTLSEPPVHVFLTATKDRGLTVSFNTSSDSSDNGGADVTQYQIEWDVMDLDAVIPDVVAATSSAKTAATISTSLINRVLFAEYTTQLLLLSATAYDVRGSFRLAFLDAVTSSLPWDASSDAITAALEALPTVGRVSVRRVAAGFGYAWFVTFLTSPFRADTSTGDVYGDISLLKVSTDSTQLLTAFSTSQTATSTLTGTGAKLATATLIRAFNGFEQQIVKVSTSAGTLGGFFRLSYNQQQTASIPANASATTVKHALTKITDAGDLVGDIDVYKRQSATPTGFVYTIVYKSRLGPNRPLVSCIGLDLTSSLTTATKSCDTTRTQGGGLPAMNSDLYGVAIVKKTDLSISDDGMAHYDVRGLRLGVGYHVRVSAWNGVGNVFGTTRASTPARFIVQSVPDAPRDVNVEPRSPTKLLVSWTQPLNTGGAPVSNYTVQIAARRGVAEQQLIKADSSLGDLSQRRLMMRLRVGDVSGSTTVLGNVSSDDLRSALANALNVPGAIARVSRNSVGVFSGYGYEWVVTFSDSIGDVPLIEISETIYESLDRSPDYMSALALSVTELVKGSVDSSSMTGAAVTTVVVTPQHEVQRVFIYSGSPVDLGGTVMLSVGGESTGALAVDATSEDVRVALEGLSTVGEVTVTVTGEVSARSTFPATRHGVYWDLTFISSMDDLPLLGVRTDATLPFTSRACGGTLTGVTPCVEGLKLEQGGLPTQAILNQLTNTTNYVVRLAASNEQFTSKFVTIPGAFQPVARPSLEVQNAQVAPLATDSLGVSWQAPLDDGGARVVHYKVQWDVSASFDLQSIFSGSDIVLVGEKDDELFDYRITGLSSSKDYFVSVVAYNARGYGSPVTAQPVDAHERVSHITVSGTTLDEVALATEMMTLSFANYPTKTVTIGVISSALELQSALQSLSVVGILLVKRSDYSKGPAATPYDTSGVDTPSDLLMTWSITFRTASVDGVQASALGALTVTHTGQSTVTPLEVVTPIEDGSLTIRPRPVSATGPRDVRVSIVDAASLGVSWLPSLSPLTSKYLVEWSTTPDFAVCRAGSISSSGTRTNYATAAANSQVISATPVGADGRIAYTILSLPANTKQYVRVSAYNGNYGSPVLAQVLSVSTPNTAGGTAVVTVLVGVKSLTPRAVTPFRPTSVTMQVSSQDQPTQIEVNFVQPTKDALGFTAGNGGATITHYRLSWWDPSALAANAKAVTSYDVRMVDPTGATLTCYPGACLFRLGAEVQSLSLTPDAVAGTGSFRLVLSSSSFTTSICSTCSLAFTAPVSGVITMDYTGTTPDLQTVLGTNARFIVDKAGAACVFEVSAVATLPANKLPIRFVSAASGSTTCPLPLTQATYAIHVEPTTACIPASTNAAGLVTAISGLVGGDGVDVSLDIEAGNIRHFRITFTGSSATGASGSSPAHTADVAQLEVVATDATGGCVDVSGNVWTGTELNGGLVTPGVAYAVQVAALNSVGIGAPLRATALCHDLPCVAGDAVLAPVAPPLAPISVTVASNRADRTALNVAWKTPMSNNGATITQYLVEYSTAAFAVQPLLCTGCVSALTAGTASLAPTLTLNSNTGLASGQIIVLSSVSPVCILTVSKDAATFVKTAWTGSLVMYNLERQHGCDAFTGQAVNLKALYDSTTDSSVAILPSVDDQQSTILKPLTPNKQYTIRARAQNREGYGAAQIATFICEPGIESCAATGTLATTRQLPAPPTLTVPSQLLGAGVVGATSNVLGFTKNSLMIAFSDPNSWSGLEIIDSFRVEWDTNADFLSSNKQTMIVTPSASKVPSRWMTRQLCANCITDLVTATNTLSVSGSLGLTFGLAKGDWIMVGAGSITCSFQVATTAPTVSAITVVGGHGCGDFTGKTVALDAQETYDYQLTTGLAMGATTHIRVTAHTSMGYGAPCDSIAVAPITSSDPPPSPYVILSALTPDDEDDPDVRVSSLRVSFPPPTISQADLNGNGGSPVTKYLVEWIDTEFANTISQVQTISTASDSSGSVAGSFVLTLDTTTCTYCQIQGIFSTSALSASASDDDMARELENLPNVGDVTVTRDSCSTKNQCTWTITFLSELDVVPALTYTSRLSAAGGKATLTVTGGTQVGSLNGATYCPSTVNNVPVSGRTNCGVVVVDAKTTPVPYEYIIKGLTPGNRYYARVAAYNALGYGPRRVTAPRSLSVPFEPPSAPRSPFNMLAPPILTLAGPTSLMISYAAPKFTGGAPVTGYMIEWDPSPEFDSGSNGDALAQVTVAASTLVAAADGAFRYTLEGLPTRQWTYVRIFAENGKVGAGVPVLTQPAREMPRGKPGALSLVTVVNDLSAQSPGTALMVSWPEASADVQLYQVEWYQQAVTEPLFGAPVVQLVKSIGTITGGYFMLSFGDGSDLYPWRMLPGTVDVEHGASFLKTSEDLTGLLAVGDVVFINKQAYLISATGSFTASQLPLADATGYQAVGTLAKDLGTSATTYAGDTVFGAKLYTQWRTTPLPMDVTPSDMQEALELLPSVGLVRVERLSVGANKYEWTVTFTSQVPRTNPAFPLLTANDRLLTPNGVGADANVAVTSIAAGQAPQAFGSAVVSATAASDDGLVMYSIPQLVTGAIYFVRVAAANERGVGVFTLASATGVAPTRSPLALENVAVRPLSPQLLEFSFDQVQTSGGRDVDGYRVGAALNSKFADPSVVLDVPPTTKYARVTTTAHTGPFLAGSTFSLAAVDARSFHGRMTKQVDALASAQALTAGSAFLLRLKPDITQGYGAASLHNSFSRGERVRIRNEEASVCLDGSVAWQLRTTDTGLTIAGYSGATITLSAVLSTALQAVIVVGTQIAVGAAANGPADPAACQAVVTAVNADKLHVDIKHSCANPGSKLANGLSIFVVKGVAPITSASYDANTDTITLSTALDNRLVDIVVVDTRISIGSTSEAAATCRARVTAATTMTLKLDHNCAEAATKLGTGNPNIFVHRGPALLPLCEGDDPWKALDASSIALLVSNLDASGGREPLPVFRSDSAVSTATELGTIGSSAEVTLVDEMKINCGDYIRLGRAPNDGLEAEDLEALATFRVRSKCDTNGCDCARSAVTRLKLGSLIDPTVAVSLAPRLDLLHGGATREIQRIVLTVTGAAVTYNTGGFRVQFGDEVSSLTLGTGGDGGASLNDDVGCLVWASGPLASDASRDMLTLEHELENFAGIDDVRVKRALTETSGVRVTVEYTVEFMGVQVRGKVPTLRILDVGINGCSAYVGGTAGVPAVQRDQNSFVTVYQAPTTPSIPFDASDEDVKAALETLSIVTNADVDRQVNKHGYDWRVTFVEFPSPAMDMESRVFPALVANGLALQAVQSPAISVTPFQRLEVDMKSLASGGGVSIYTRVRAHNADGWGDTAVPTPVSIQLADQVPDVVRLARADVLSGSQVLVQWDAPVHDGGEPVTEFRVEWWLDGALATAAKPFAVVHALEAASQSVTDDVATITVSAPTAGTNTHLSGTFRVGFDGQWSPELSYDISAVDMQKALVALSTIENVLVNRELTAGGYTWLVTFLQRKYGGNQHKRWRSALATQSPFGYKLEVSGTNLLACTTAEQISCVPHLPTIVAPRAAVDATPELQHLVCISMGNVAVDATMSFKLKILEFETGLILGTANAQALATAITALGVVGIVNVRFRNTAQTTVCSASATAKGLTIEFTTAQGDMPPIVATTKNGVGVTIKEQRKGRAQLHVGRLPFAYVIDGLAAGTYHARVAAYNSVGFGPFQEATDAAGLLLVARPPTAPRSLRVKAKMIDYSHGMLAVWTAPRSDDSNTDQYRVEWDHGAGFSSQCGENIETQTLVVTNAVANVANKKFTVQTANGGTKVGCVDPANLVTSLQTPMRALGGVYAGGTAVMQGDDSATYDYGRTYTVTFPQSVAVPSVGYDAAENTAMATSPVDIPLLYWDAADATCTASPPDSVVAQRTTYGPGLDAKRGQGRIGFDANNVFNNECSAALAGPIARQTVDAATVTANAFKPEILSLAAKSGVFESADLARPVLCESCAQKLTIDGSGNGKLTVTTSVALSTGDYFIVADSPTSSTSSTTLRCVMKVLSKSGNVITVDPNDPGRSACELPVTYEAKAWRISRFELRAHTIRDLIPGREYAVRVVASSSTLGESPALATATTITAT